MQREPISTALPRSRAAKQKKSSQGDVAPPDVGSIADVSLPCGPSDFIPILFWLLLCTSFPLFEEYNYVCVCVPFLTHWLRKIMHCDLENLLAAVQEENPLQVSQSQHVASGALHAALGCLKFISCICCCSFFLKEQKDYLPAARIISWPACV